MNGTLPFQTAPVGLAGEVPPIVDAPLGSTTFLWPRAAQLSLTPQGATAAGSLTLLTLGRRPRLQHRDFARLETWQAALLATTASALRAARASPHASEPLRQRLEEIAAIHRFDDVTDVPGDVERALALFRTCDAREPVSDPLHPPALAAQFSLAKVSSERPWGDLTRATSLTYAGEVVWLLNAHADERVTAVVMRADNPRNVEESHVLPTAALVLVAITEAIAHVEQAQARFAVEPEALADKRRALLALRRSLGVDHIDPVDVCDDVMATFDEPRAPELPWPRRIALATMAMRRWTARRGGQARGQALTLGRMTTVFHGEPVRAGGALAFRTGRAALVVRCDDDLAVGAGAAIGPRQMLHRSALAAGPDTFEFALRASRAAERARSRQLERYLLRAITDPWFDSRRDVPPTLAALL